MCALLMTAVKPFPIGFQSTPLSKEIFSASPPQSPRGGHAAWLAGCEGGDANSGQLPAEVGVGRVQQTK